MAGGDSGFDWAVGAIGFRSRAVCLIVAGRARIALHRARVSARARPMGGYVAVRIPFA